MAAAAPAPAPAPAPEVHLEAQAKLGQPPEDSAPFTEALNGAARKGIEAAGVVERPDAPARLALEITWEDERRIDYVGHIELRVENDPAAEPLAIRAFGCDMCGAEELLDRVQSEVTLALANVTWPEPEPVAPAPTSAAAPVEGPRRSGERLRLHALGATGLGLSGLGIVSVAVGAVLWSRDDRIELRPEDLEGPVWKRSVRPPGIALVAAGAGAVVLGGTLVAVDLIRGRRSGVALRPVLAPGLAGLTLGGTF